jgi:hypothetical protein
MRNGIGTKQTKLESPNDTNRGRTDRNRNERVGLRHRQRVIEHERDRVDIE